MLYVIYGSFCTCTIKGLLNDGSFRVKLNFYTNDGFFLNQVIELFLNKLFFEPNDGTFLNQRRG